MLMFMVVRPRVKRGAALLDRESPGWASKVDTGKLDMGYVHKCVLGQVEGDYSYAVGAFDIRNPERHGFASYNRWGLQPRLYRLLKKAWTQEIEKRRILTTA